MADKHRQRGTIRPYKVNSRGMGTYQVHLYIGRDERGQRRYTARTVHGNRKNAEEALREMLSEKDAGKLRQRQKLTLAEVCDLFLQDGVGARGKLGPRTMEDHRSALATVKASELGGIQLDSVTKLCVAGYFRRASAAGVSPHAQRKVYASLRSVWWYARQFDLTGLGSPLEGLPQPKVELGDKTVLDTAQRETLRRELVARASDSEAAVLRRSRALLFLVLLETGLRPGEAAGLRWEDLDLRSKPATLSVRQSVKWLASSGHEVGPPKTKKARRTVPLPGPLRALLHAHFLRMARDDRAASDQLVFQCRAGTPETWRNISRRDWAEIKKAAGLDASFKAYNLRHTRATSWLAEGRTPKFVSTKLGHTSIAFTLATYVQDNPAEDEAAVADLEAGW